MAVTEDLIVKVQADTSKAVQSLDLLASSVAGIQAELLKMSTASGKTEKAVTGMGSSAVKLNQALELAKKGFAVLFEPLKNMVKEFQAGQDEITRLGKTLQLMGNRDVNGTVKHFMELADQLKENTTVEDELVISLARVGSTLDLTTAQIDKMIETAIDMAAVTGGSVEQAFQGLVNTLRGNARGAGDLAILLQDLTKEELEAGKGIDILNAKLKGLAKSEAGTSVGKIIIVMRELGDLGKDIGAILSAGLGLGTAGNDALETIKSIRKELESIKPVVIDVITFMRALITGLVTAIKSVDFTALIESLFRLGLNVLTLTAYLTPFAAIIGAVYLSFSTLGPAVLATSKSMLVMSAATAAAAAKFLILGSAIAVGAVALDFWIANMERTGDVIGLFIGNIRVGLIGIFADIFEKMGWDTLADHFREKSKELVDYTEKVGDGLVDGALVEGIKQAGNAVMGFGQGFDAVADSAYTAQNSVQQFANGAGETTKKIRGMTEEGKKLIQELANTVAKLGAELADVGASEGQKIAANNAERIRELGLLEQKLAKERALGPIQQQQLKDAIAISNAIAAKQAGELKKKNLTEEINRTKELAGQIADMNATTMDRIQAEKQAGLDAIAKRREELALDKDINKEALAHLDAQEALLKMKADMAAEKAPDAGFESAQTAGGNLGASVAKAFQGPISGMLAGAGAFADAIQGLIDFVPQMLEKISGVFSSLTELPGKILEGFSKLGESILKFVSDFIPNIVNMIPKLIEKFVEFFSKLPDVVAELLANLPDMLLGLLDRLPELVENFVQKLAESSPKIIVSLINFLVKKAPYIALELSKALAIEIPMAIIKGILDAIKSLPKIFSNLGKGMLPKPGEIAKNFALGLKAATKTLTGVASKLFAVFDLEETAKTQSDKLQDLVKSTEQLISDLGDAAKNAGKSMWDAFVQAFKDAIKWFMDRGKEIWDGLVNAFKAIAKWFADRGREIWDGFIVPVAMWFKERGREIWDGFIVPVAMWFKERGQEIWDGFVVPVAMWFKDRGKDIWSGFIEPVATWFADRGKEIWNGFIAPIGDAFIQAGIAIWRGLYDSVGTFFTQAGQAIWSGLLQPIGDFFANAGKTIWSNFYAAVSNFFEQFGQRIFNGLTGGLNNFDFGNIGTKIWEGLRNGLGNIGAVIAGQLNGINPASMFERMFRIPSSAFGDPGPVERGLKTDIPYMTFAKGGLVPGRSLTDGDSLLNDKILALLSPGEAVIPKSAMKDPVIAKLIKQVMTGGDIPAFGKGGYATQLSGKLKATAEDPIGTVVNEAINAGNVVSDTVDQVLEKLDPKTLWDSVLGQVSQAVLKIFESNKFHDGGEVPAMLKPGEFVMNTGAVASAGTGFLENLNRGGGVEKETVINNVINLTINTTQPMDEAFIKTKVYPVVRDQMKRASIDGQTLVYSPGVRSA